MPFSHHFKPSHKEIKRYYEDLAGYAAHEVEHEGATSSAFQNLLAATCKKADWHLVPQLATKIKGKTVRPDGTLRDDFNLHHGYWEAKDSADKIDVEIRKKIALGYPLSNTIFEDTATAVLFQNGVEQEPRYDLTNEQDLCDLLNKYYSHVEPDIADFEQAVDEFKERVPQLALAVKEKIEAAHKSNKKFQAAFETFFDLCRVSLNPNLSASAVDEMLIQHLLTIRLFDTIFDNPDFVRRNVIAAEVEKVIDALASKAFSREQFLKSLDRFYVAIESAAKVLGEDFTEKQHFLNTVYERFFQGYSVKVADTHGIVYTPQEIVDFMCASVEEVLKTEFGKTLGSRDVNILDPCTGTGNFIVNLIRRVPKRDLARVYREQLFANEVMLLPYYIAALNIEHAFFESSGEYEAFEGLCFVDTLDLAREGHVDPETRKRQRHFDVLSEKNTERVERQKRSPITVIIGNPPYNVGQLNENDNNKNRAYPIVEGRIAKTYAKDSQATNKKALSDAYVKFFRWSVDRISQDGMVCLVTNNSFFDQLAFDGMRKHLMNDFTRIYHVHLEGNVRHNPTLAGTTYNVFGIQVGVGITIAVRHSLHSDHRLSFARVDKFLRRETKLAWLNKQGDLSGVNWVELVPNARHQWLTSEHADQFTTFLQLAVPRTEHRTSADEGIFDSYCRGLETTRDAWVYDFDRDAVSTRVQRLIDVYNGEIDRWKRAKRPADIDDFVETNEQKIKWSSRLKETFAREQYATFDNACIRKAIYRPFNSLHVYFDSILNQRPAAFAQYFPAGESQRENQVLVVTDKGSEKPFMMFIAPCIADLHVVGAGAAAQCFPFYVYDEDGTNRRENITDWALAHFREHYHDQKISKWDIFYYVYGILHHPGYRTKFADNLKRELPRIPLAPNHPSPSPSPSRGGGQSKSKNGSGFWAFAKAGKKLAELHLGYEQLEPWPLKWIETEGEPLSYHVEKMRLSKDKTQLKINESLTLAKVPPEVFNYRLGNRSAVDWVIDQYQISTDKRSGITSDPNNPDDEEYIVRLVGQVVRVSIETVKIVNGLPTEFSDAKV